MGQKPKTRENEDMSQNDDKQKESLFSTRAQRVKRTSVKPYGSRMSIMPSTATPNPRQRRNTILSNFATTPTVGKSDPRPLRSTAFQNGCYRRILNYLQVNGYDQPIDRPRLTSPSTKTFQAVFTFLYTHISPNVNLTEIPVDEIPKLIRSIKYPFPDKIVRSTLMAVASPHSWPLLLALLDWMVFVCQALGKMRNLGGDGLHPDEEHKNNQLIIDQLSAEYAAFMAGKDEQQANLRRKFTEGLNRSAKILKRTVENCQAEIQLYEKKIDSLGGPQSLSLTLRQQLDELGIETENCQLKEKKYSEDCAKRTKKVEEEADLLRLLKSSHIDQTNRNNLLLEQIEAQAFSIEEIVKLKQDKAQQETRMLQLEKESNLVTSKKNDLEIEAERRLREVETVRQSHLELTYAVKGIDPGIDIDFKYDIAPTEASVEKFLSVDPINLKERCEALKAVYKEQEAALKAEVGNYTAKEDDLEGTVADLTAKERDMEADIDRLSTIYETENELENRTYDQFDDQVRALREESTMCREANVPSIEVNSRHVYLLESNLMYLKEAFAERESRLKELVHQAEHLETNVHEFTTEKMQEISETVQLYTESLDDVC